MKAYAIRRPDTAFSKSPVTKKKRPRENDPSHLRFVGSLPCLITGRRPSEACHIRYPDPRYGKRETGLSEKAHDKFTVPMHADLHREQHSMNERAFWDRYGIDPIRVALALWANSGDDEVCEQILNENRP